MDSIKKTTESYNSLDNSFIKILIVIIVFFIFIFCLYILFSIVLLPFMKLFNKFTDNNISNVPDKRDYLLGTLSEKVGFDHVGEVLINSSNGTSIRPAKLYKKEDFENQIELPKNSPVIIIDFDDNGNALVIKNKNI